MNVMAFKLNKHMLFSLIIGNNVNGMKILLRYSRYVNGITSDRQLTISQIFELPNGTPLFSWNGCQSLNSQYHFFYLYC